MKMDFQARPRPKYDLDDVKRAAAGRWREILPTITGLPLGLLDGRHHPCPSGQCSSKKDAFRALNTIDQDGACICSQCGAKSDGIEVIRWLTGCKFPESLEKVAEYLGIEPNSSKPKNKKEKKSDESEPYINKMKIGSPKQREDIWNRLELMLEPFMRSKPGINKEAILECGGMFHQHPLEGGIIALPIRHADQSVAIGWVAYPRDPAKPLYAGGEAIKGKPKTLKGSKSGVIGRIDYDSGKFYKVEGVSDLLSLVAMGIEGTIITNSDGAGGNPEKFADWLPELINGREIIVIHDADKPGQEGATYIERPNGSKRLGWAPWLAKNCPNSIVRNVQLPYPLEESHGKDLRDWILEGNGPKELASLVAQSQIITPPAADSKEFLNFEYDDPHRLARVVLDQYQIRCEGTLVYWKEQFWKWKYGKYQNITVNNLRSKINMIVHQEFVRYWKELKGDKEKKIPKVTRSIVSNVIEALSGIVRISDNLEMPCWIPDRKRRNYLAFTNGILDLDGLLKESTKAYEDHYSENIKYYQQNPESQLPAISELIDCKQHLHPHSPQWFSTLRLDYEYDPNARCPFWEQILGENLRGIPQEDEQGKMFCDDGQDLVKIIQEWSGYCLTPDNSFQKMLVLEGEGGNGKSVYFGGLRAILGEQNVSSMGIEGFAGRFSLFETLGKAVNICGDVGELDNAAEGQIKQFVSGDSMQFEQKGTPTFSSRPTAKLVAAWNNRPRIKDKSEGIWRRIIIVPFERSISEDKKIQGLDKPEYWIQKGEAPGMLNWALDGLIRLLITKQFQKAERSERAKSAFKTSANPILEFLEESVAAHEDGEVRTSFLYHHYVEWCKKSGHSPANSSNFGKEIKRKFNVEKKRKSSHSDRNFYYPGIVFKADSNENQLAQF